MQVRIQRQEIRDVSGSNCRAIAADSDIEYDITMLTADEINEIRTEIEDLRQRAGGVRDRELDRILDRVCNRRSAGKHAYAWTSKVGRRGFPITVPRHSKPIAKGTLHNILDDIEAELEEMERRLSGELGED